MWAGRMSSPLCFLVGGRLRARQVMECCFFGFCAEESEMFREPKSRGSSFHHFHLIAKAKNQT